MNDTNQEIPQAPNSSANTKRLIGAIFALIVVLASGSWLWTKVGLDSDLGLSWREYINTDFGISLEYPDHWDVEINQETGNITFTSKKENDSLIKTLPGDYDDNRLLLASEGKLSLFSVTLEKDVNPEGLGVKEWFDMENLTFDTSIISVSDVEVAGEKGVSLKFNRFGIWDVTYLPKGADVLVIAYQSENQHKAIYDRMVRTLKFSK